MAEAAPGGSQRQDGGGATTPRGARAGGAGRGVDPTADRRRSAGLRRRLLGGARRSQRTSPPGTLATQRCIHAPALRAAPREPSGGQRRGRARRSHGRLRHRRRARAELVPRLPLRGARPPGGRHRPAAPGSDPAGRGCRWPGSAGRRPGDLCRGHPAGLERAVRLARDAAARPDLPARRHAAPDALRHLPPSIEGLPFERLEASRRRAVAGGDAGAPRPGRRRPPSADRPPRRPRRGAAGRSSFATAATDGPSATATSSRAVASGPPT